MDVTYLGAGSVKLSGKNINVVCDPYDDAYGLGKLKAASDVDLLTDASYKPRTDAKMTIDGPGEYEVSGSMITGVPVQRHVDEEGVAAGTAYSVEIEDFKIVVLGNTAPKLPAGSVETLTQPDVLVLPVGGHGLTLDAQAAAEIVSQLEPKFVVPVHFDDGKTKYAMPQDGIDKFLSEMGAKPEPQSKLKLTSKDLPLETTVVVLKRAGE